MRRVIHTGRALVDVVVEVPSLPRRGQNVMAGSSTRYAGGSVSVLVAAARFGAACVHAGAHGTGPNGDLVRASLAAEDVALSAPAITARDTATCLVLGRADLRDDPGCRAGHQRGVAVHGGPAGRRPAQRERRQIISDWPGSGPRSTGSLLGDVVRTAERAWRSASRVAASSAASSSLRARSAVT